MAENTLEEQQQADLREWYKTKLGELVQEILKKGVLNGVAIEAVPVWAAQGQVLIAKIWSTAEKSKFIWAISGEAVITDHIAGDVAVNPQEVARHFALKWQVDADRLGNIAQSRSPVENSEAHMEGYTDKLIQSAELLYEMSTHDEHWKAKHH